MLSVVEDDPTPAKPPKRPAPPTGLGSAGKGLWTRMHERLEHDLRFSVHELEVLTRACRVADREDELRKLLKRDGLTIGGSTGQTRLHPAVAELRQVETSVVALLQRISIVDTAGKPMTPAQSRGKKAAETRWDMERAKRGG